MVSDSDSLEVLDQRIVAALQVHPRAGVGEIARILGEHERSVARRVQRLATSGVFRPTAEYDVARCGLGNVVHVRLKVDGSTGGIIATELARRHDVHAVTAVSGGSGLLWCEFVAMSRMSLHSLMTEGVPDIPQAEVLDAYINLRSFVTDAQWHAPLITPAEEKALRASTVQPLPNLADRYELTPTDRRVAAILMRNVRISLTDLARELDFSVATAGRRVTSLLERQILRPHTVVDPALLERPVEARLRLKVRPAEIEAVGTALAACPEVRCCAAVTGQYNLLTQICLEHETGLYRFLIDRLGAIPPVTDVDTEMITRTYKRGGVTDTTAMTPPDAPVPPPGPRAADPEPPGRR